MPLIFFAMASRERSKVGFSMGEQSFTTALFVEALMHQNTDTVSVIVRYAVSGPAISTSKVITP